MQSGNWLEKMSDRTFSAVKWALTAMSGLVTTGLILVLES